MAVPHGGGGNCVGKRENTSFSSQLRMFVVVIVERGNRFESVASTTRRRLARPAGQSQAGGAGVKGRARGSQAGDDFHSRENSA